MTKLIASIAGLTIVAAMAACADGAMKLAAHSDAEESVTLDEAVVEAEFDANGGILTEFEDLQNVPAESESDVVDLDWASDSG